MGEDYGAIQASGLSATHEESHEAKDRKEILAFVQEEVTRDVRQESFIKEAQAWNTGLFRSGFKTAADLRTLVTRAIHDHELKNATGPVNAKETLDRAINAIPKEDRHYMRTGGPWLHLSLAGAPLQSVLRPTALEDADFGRKLLQACLFGEHAIFNTNEKNSDRVRGHAVLLDQGDGNASLSLNEQGDVLVGIPIKRGRHDRGMSMPVVIEEDLKGLLLTALVFTGNLLEMIDPMQRLTQIAIAATVSGGSFLTWRTRAEQDASPDSYTVGFGERDTTPFTLRQEFAPAPL